MYSGQTSRPVIPVASQLNVAQMVAESVTGNPTANSDIRCSVSHSHLPMLFQSNKASKSNFVHDELPRGQRSIGNRSCLAASAQDQVFTAAKAS
jgi:hypothetical protein